MNARIAAQEWYLARLRAIDEQLHAADTHHEMCTCWSLDDQPLYYEAVGMRLILMRAIRAEARHAWMGVTVE